MGIINNFKKSADNLLCALQECNDLSIIDSAIAQLADTLHGAYKLKAQMKPIIPHSIVDCGDVEVIRKSMRQLVDACLYDFDNKVKKNAVFLDTWEPPHVQLPMPLDFMLMEVERSCKSGHVKNMFFTKKMAKAYKKLYTQLPETNPELTRQAAEKAICDLLTYIEQNNLIPLEAKYRLPRWFKATKRWQLMDVFDSSDVVLQEANRVRLAKEDGKRLRNHIFPFVIAERILQLYGCVYGESILYNLSEHIEATRVTSSDNCNSSNESSPRKRKKLVFNVEEDSMKCKRPRTSTITTQVNSIKEHQECEVERSSESPPDSSTDDANSENESFELQGSVSTGNDDECKVITEDDTNEGEKEINRMMNQMDVTLENKDTSTRSSCGLDNENESENKNVRVDKGGFLSKLGLPFW